MNDDQNFDELFAAIDRPVPIPEVFRNRLWNELNDSINVRTERLMDTADNRDHDADRDDLVVHRSPNSNPKLRSGPVLALLVAAVAVLGGIIVWSNASNNSSERVVAASDETPVDVKVSPQVACATFRALAFGDASSGTTVGDIEWISSITKEEFQEFSSNLVIALDHLIVDLSSQDGFDETTQRLLEVAIAEAETAQRASTAGHPNAVGRLERVDGRLSDAEVALVTNGLGPCTR